jgi:glycosyltransferase involved in cell wall biosynthesis
MRVLALFQEADLCEAHIFAEMSRRGVNITAYLNPSCRHTAVLKEAGIDCQVWDTRSRFSFGTIKLLRSLLHRENFDVIHCLSNRSLTNLLLAGIPKKTALVVYRGTMGHLSKWSPLSWLSYLHPRLDKIICVSDAVKSYMATLVNPSKLVRIYKGHDPAWYTKSVPLSRGELGLPSTAIIVTCLANMRAVKGVRYLLEALREIRNDSVYLLLVGHVNDSEVHALVQDVNLSKRIKLTGFRPDAARYLAASDIFVMPSIAREGLPKALVEAMCLGIAPVVTKVGGMPEIVEHEKSGLVVAAQNATELASSIERLANDPQLRARLAGAAAKRVRELLPIESTVLQTLEVYKHVCRDRTEGRALTHIS